MTHPTKFKSQKHFEVRRDELRALRESALTVALRFESVLHAGQHESPIDTAELRAIMRAPNPAPAIREFSDERFVADLYVPEADLDLLYQEVFYCITDGCPETLSAPSRRASQHRPA